MEFDGSAASANAVLTPKACFTYQVSPKTKALIIGAAFLRPLRREEEEAAASDALGEEPDDRCYEVLTFQFEDSVLLTSLESLLVRFSPSHCHYPEPEAQQQQQSSAKRSGDTSFLARKMQATFESLGIEGVPHKTKIFTVCGPDEIEQDLRAVLGIENMPPVSLKIGSEEWGLSFRAASVLLRKEGFVSRDDLREKCVLTMSTLGQYMRLDSAALSALNLFPSTSAESASAYARNDSVLSVLDKTVTKRIGSRLLARWMRQPLLDPEAIFKRQDCVELLVNDTSSRERLRSILKSVPDLDLLLTRMRAKRAGLEELYHLYVFANALPELRDVLKEIDARADGPLGVYLSKINALLSGGKFGKYKTLVESILDLKRAPREFLVNHVHDATGELTELSEKRDELEDELAQLRTRLESKTLRAFDARFEENSKMNKTHGLHYRVSKKFDADLKEIKSDGARYLQVYLNGIRWTNDSLHNLGEQLDEVAARYASAQDKLVKEASGVAASYAPVVESAARLVAELDVFASLAHVAAYAPNGGYVRPKVTPMGSNRLTAKQARHPVLETLSEFVANDHDMVRETSHFVILTGPNMGGKSTYARQLGCLIVMAQMGSFVPAQECEMPCMDAILARVGASDHQLRGVSTFMSEMLEAGNILRTATRDSLVIVDELGRGTSTYDGFGLAWAISEHLAQKTQSFSVFATHFHELTSLDKVVPGVFNAHVAAKVDEKTDQVSMLHEVRAGVCDESYGINIARIAGFPSDVIEIAKAQLAELEKFQGFDLAEEEKRRETCATDPRVKRLRATIERMDEGASIDELREMILSEE